MAEQITAATRDIDDGVHVGEVNHLGHTATGRPDDTAAPVARRWSLTIIAASRSALSTVPRQPTNLRMRNILR